MISWKLIEGYWEKHANESFEQRVIDSRRYTPFESLRALELQGRLEA